MDRRDLLRLIALAPLSVPGCSGPDYPVTVPAAGLSGRLAATGAGFSGTRFYVSPRGDDAASGRDPGTPWRSIEQVNAQLAGGGIGQFDTVLFERGATFPGKIRIPGGRPTGGGLLTLGAYSADTSADAAGSALDRPVISGYVLLDDPARWRASGPGRWAVDLSRPGGEGYQGAEGGLDNIGFLRVDGVVHGRRVSGAADLREQWDFHCAGSTLLVRSAAHPLSLARDIRAATHGHQIELGNCVRITGLRLEGGGSHGIQGSARTVRIDDNELAELGGGALNPTTRYGNGIELWIDSADVLVERNVLHDIYDVALTAQGGPDSDTGGWRDLTFRDNLIYSCNQSLEFWSAGDPARDPGFVRCLVECNTCLYAGYCWSEPVRPDRETSVHLLTYGWDLPADITVRRNVFFDPLGAYRSSSTSTPGLTCADNVILGRPGGLLKMGDRHTVDDGPAGVASLGNDAGSTVRVMTASATGGARPDVADALRQVAPFRAGCPPLPRSGS